MKNDAIRLILASGSQTRLKLLKQSGIECACYPASVDEDGLKSHWKAEGRNVREVALKLAEEKACLVASQRCAQMSSEEHCLIIGADQMLECEGAWFDKPLNLDAAGAQLRSLRGRTHVLHSAVVLLDRTEIVWRHLSHATLTMRMFSDRFIEKYLQQEAENCLQCVGAYRVEGPGGQLFEHVGGDYSTILGLPLLPLLGELRKRDVLEF
ncbi:hypothetical protein B0W47_15115 [Komagataeibacter nataicola]|uniref:Nucleoside triphosphate pyrophosphatase n=3 Tax=Acetobacteraceae TaxID=433 RepID=A0A939HN67_9PROT|nr:MULTISPECIES: nucleoside triphosphate pyrophosphatase [Acetobacteraceae]AQU89152.1 hypothetical protein B0W47_15115 [Komagataeibacter nataicola]MBO1326792.1 Maf-like protein [Acetobacter garciniae]MBX0346531.1 Maf family protein [Acetobacter garciniae]OUJ06399.1 hypothetical protein HK23_02325 [Acetobacter malorum]PYD64828.1 hypothetical protein CDI09_17115 [Komagataeibacter nataicola]